MTNASLLEGTLYIVSPLTYFASMPGSLRAIQIAPYVSTWEQGSMTKNLWKDSHVTDLSDQPLV
ncbi:MAG TPA: hypothetical protein VFN35_36815, partial [Ktedonobacteraceae bacterium]|nr:hypothetical protein [Ktedonobacteraceae bacterium]